MKRTIGLDEPVSKGVESTSRGWGTDWSYTKNKLLSTLIISIIIFSMSIIISTLIYVNYNRYEYHADDNIVFDKRTGLKYSSTTLGRNP
jgi:hypothetical protein